MLSHLRRAAVTGCAALGMLFLTLLMAAPAGAAMPYAPHRNNMSNVVYHPRMTMPYASRVNYRPNIYTSYAPMPYAVSYYPGYTVPLYSASYYPAYAPSYSAPYMVPGYPMPYGMPAYGMASGTGTYCMMPGQLMMPGMTPTMCPAMAPTTPGGY